LHKLLLRQLKRFNCTAQFNRENDSFLQAISSAYEQNDQEVTILERSLFVISKELNERNKLLKEQLNTLGSTQEKLQQSLAVVNATFDSTGEIILVYDNEGGLLNINSMGKAFFMEEFGREHEHWSDIFQIVKFPEGLHYRTSTLQDNPNQIIEGTSEFFDSRFYHYRSLPQVSEGKVIGRVWCLRDVTQQKKNEKMIEHQAYHDALTGLPNRLLLVDRLQHALNLAKREKTLLAVIFIDLDNFKKVNDSEGHEAGDEILKQVVNRIQSRLRSQDTLARLGGDEFVILLELVKESNSIATLSQEILELLATPFKINRRQFFISSSMGISLHPKDDDEPEALIRKADMAMYHAKNLGKNNIQYYHQDFENDALQKLDLEQALRQALEANELCFYFQPLVNLKEKKIYAAEALIRWIKPDGSFIAPDVFIPLAEQTGLIKKIGSLAIQQACKQLAAWRKQGLPDMKISINISSVEFQSNSLITDMLHYIEEYKIDGRQLIVEVTESLFMEDKGSVQLTMLELQKVGVTFALDDFGKGYSSFSYLQDLPIDYLKIDKAFLNNVISNKQSSAIARTIIDVGINLDLQVIAEGIEDQATLDYVINHRCDMGQGYYLYRPMHEQKLTQILLAENSQTNNSH
jgi:diguanylate cyclase (GGDEF)-like protein